MTTIKVGSAGRPLRPEAISGRRHCEARTLPGLRLLSASFRRRVSTSEAIVTHPWARFDGSGCSPRSQCGVFVGGSLHACISVSRVCYLTELIYPPLSVFSVP
jgi:hypothetical protein